MFFSVLKDHRHFICSLVFKEVFANTQNIHSLEEIINKIILSVSRMKVEKAI